VVRVGFVAIIACLAIAGSAARAQPVESFESFIAGFEARAVAEGISPQTYRAATAGLTPDPNIPNIVSSQPEFTTPVWEYIEGRVSAGRIARGREAMAQNAALFEAIGARYGVDPHILGAIWGMETDFGAVLSNSSLIKPVIRSLATLVHRRRGRVEADEDEFLAALRLIERGPYTAQTLVGSWAGAIGHLQAGPSVILAHGQDGDGDGAVDPHRSLADALATSANFLRSLGYRPGVDWGLEVEVPGGFDYLLATREVLRPVRFFADRGVQRVAGRQFGDLDEPVFLYVPAGRQGPKFLMTQNYLVLKGYNFSDSYAMSVAHLTDRLKGGGPHVTPWPRQTRFPNLEQRVAIQRWLAQLGYYTGEVDGRIGPITQVAYQKFQSATGQVADGFITYAAYETLEAAVR
jgi:membrane-bound lytic murein transglycosylase B